MLDNPCSKICQLHTVFFPFSIQEFNLDPAPSLHITRFSRYWEASFFVTTFVRRCLDNHRIDHGNGTIILIVVCFHQWDDNKSLVDSYLWCCESDSTIIRIFDMLDHIFRKSSIFPEFIRLNRSWYCTKYGVIFSCLYAQSCHWCKFLINCKENIESWVE